MRVSRPSRSYGGRRPGGRAAVDDEVVAFGLARDRVARSPRSRRSSPSEARKRRAQVGGVLLAEAHVERARAGHAHAVAALAEIVRQRRDEAEAAAGLLHAHIARRAAGAVRRCLRA